MLDVFTVFLNKDDDDDDGRVGVSLLKLFRIFRPRFLTV